MNFNTLKKAAEFRVIENKDNYWIEDYRDAAITIFSKDIGKTIYFFQNECTDEELYYLAEIFEELAEETQSRELIDVLRARLAMVTPETYHQQSLACKHMRKYVDYAEFVRSVGEEIDFAEGKLDIPSESHP